MCTSHRTAVRVMDALAIEFDSDVYNWKGLLECKLDQVCIIQYGIILYNRNYEDGIKQKY